VDSTRRGPWTWTRTPPFERGSGLGGEGPPLYSPTMSVRPIVLLGDPRLRLKGQPVDSFGKYLHELLDDLTDSMRHAPGVGLAAPQLGEPLLAAVIEVAGQLHELVNPRIVRTTGDDRDLEGCLSIPGYVAYVTRREKVWVVAQNRFGRKIKVAGSGLLARALQHELDHLDGRLYIDYLDSMDELIAVGKGEDESEEVQEAERALA
jgi:peptide deformylase